MKLDKKTRAALYKAHRANKALEVKWPSSKQPITGHSYKLDEETRIRVEKFHRNGWKALIRLDHDPIHLLHALKGTRNQNGDYETEPEAIHSSDQALLDAAGAQVTVIQGAERRREERKQRNALRASERTNAPAWLTNLT